MAPATITEAILKMDVNGIRKFLEHLSQQHYSPATMARKIATLRSFHRWLEKSALIGENPPPAHRGAAARTVAARSRRAQAGRRGVPGAV